MLGIAIITPTFCSPKTDVNKLFEGYHTWQHAWQHDTSLLETRANYSFFLLDACTSDEVQKLNHANALSNYVLPQIAPTFNAGRCIVTKQEIINMFHFWMSSINMHELFSSHKNSLLFNSVLPPSPSLPVPFHKARVSFLSGQFKLSNFPIERAKVRLVEQWGY